MIQSSCRFGLPLVSIRFRAGAWHSPPDFVSSYNDLAFIQTAALTVVAQLDPLGLQESLVKMENEVTMEPLDPRDYPEPPHLSPCTPTDSAVFAPPDPGAQLAQRELLDPRENKGHRDHMVAMATMVAKDPKDHKDLRERRDPMANLEPLDARETMEPVDKRDPLDHPDQLDHKAQKEAQDPRDQLASPETKELRDHRDPLDHKDHQAKQATQDHKVHLEDLAAMPATAHALAESNLFDEKSISGQEFQNSRHTAFTVCFLYF